MTSVTLTWCHACGATYAVEDGHIVPCRHDAAQQGQVKFGPGRTGFVLPAVGEVKR